MPILTPSSRPDNSQEGGAYFTSRATAIAVGRTAVKQAVLERFPVGRTAVKQAVLERFPAAHAKLAPSLRCALRKGTTAGQGWKDRETSLTRTWLPPPTPVQPSAPAGRRPVLGADWKCVSIKRCECCARHSQRLAGRSRGAPDSGEGSSREIKTSLCINSNCDIIRVEGICGSPGEGERDGSTDSEIGA